MGQIFDDVMNIFNGQTPIKRQNPRPGESEYYRVNPGQNLNTSTFTNLQTTDIDDNQPLFNTGQGLNQGQQVQTGQENNGLNNWLANQIPSIVGSTAFNALNLYNKKREMDQANQVGYDNYAHRLAMCENAQNGPFDAAVSLGGGIIKEAYDLTKKIPQQGLIKPFQDSFKDMSNNIEGLQYGLTHPFNNCRTWLNNLDYENNKWKK